MFGLAWFSFARVTFAPFVKLASFRCFAFTAFSFGVGLAFAPSATSSGLPFSALAFAGASVGMG